MRARQNTQKSINNFLGLAYNNHVEEITVTQNGFNSLYMSYLYGRVKERFSFLPAEFSMRKSGEQTQIEMKTERAYSPYVRKFTEENIADIIAVGYKYAFFDKKLQLPLLSPKQKRLFITALVSADLPEDRGYVLRRFSGGETYSLDGVYHFRLKELIKRWEEIVAYVPLEMGEASMENFLGYLAEDGRKKLFVKGGQVYDEEYRKLSKSALTGERSAVGEILLGQAERIYCFGETDEETANFLKKYYGEKAVFC